MLSDLLIGPSPTCQHGNRKLHRRQLPRNLSPVFRIMKRHPAPAERNHTLRDPLIRLRIPVPDTSLDQPPQKPMMLNKRLQKPIHLRQLPAPEHLLLCLLLMLSVDRTHRHHTVDIRHTDRIRPIRHKQSSLPHPISTPYLPVKISMVCHHIRGKKPQPAQYSSNPHSQTPQQPPEPSQAQKTNSKAAKPHNHTYTPLPSKTQAALKKTTLKTKPTNLRSPHTSHINTHPKPITHPSSTHIRSSSLKSHKTVTKTPDINQPVNQSTNQANHLFP